MKLLLVLFHVPAGTYLKDFKASNVEDSQEGGTLAFGLVQSFVHSKQDPAEEALKYGFSQGFDSKVSLS